MRGTRELALMRIVAQRLAGPGLASAADAARWMTAVQAQDFRGAVTSLALRTEQRSRDGVIDALNAGEIVRSWPMRGTLHFVAAEDLGWVLELVGGRVIQSVAGRHARLGLDGATLERARELTVTRLSGGHAIDRAELLSHWAEAGIDAGGQRGVHILGHLCRSQTICLGPVAGERQLIVLSDEWITTPRRLEREQALGEWAERYLRSHGPATIEDFKRWTGLTLTDARAGVALARSRLETLQVDGAEYLLDPETPALLATHRADALATRLLPGFDELVLGYADRSMTVPERFAERVVPGGNGMFLGTVIDGGRAVGTWRRGGSTRHRTIDATPFDSFSTRVDARLPRLFERLP